MIFHFVGMLNATTRAYVWEEINLTGDERADLDEADGEPASPLSAGTSKPATRGRPNTSQRIGSFGPSGVCPVGRKMSIDGGLGGPVALGPTG